MQIISDKTYRKFGLLPKLTVKVRRVGLSAINSKGTVTGKICCSGNKECK